MKKVLKNQSQVAHFWANQLQSEGRANSLFFEGDTIYSWGHHYQIARIVTDNNGDKVVFINSNGYSSSTGKHTHIVRHSIPSDVKVFYVPFISSRTFYSRGIQSFDIAELPAILNIMEGQVSDLLDKQLVARSNSYHFREAQTKLSIMTSIAERFGLKVPHWTDFRQWEAAHKKCVEIKATEGERAEKRELNRLKKQAEQAKIEAEKVEKWERGEINGSFYNVDTRLRLSEDGKEIETSRGASVPLEEAKAMYKRLKAGVDCRREKLGGYTVLDSDSNTVTIGCHVIRWHIAAAFFAKIA